MTNLVGRPRADLERLLGPEVDRPFRARQVASWLLDRHATSFAEMTNLPKTLRAALAERFTIRDPEILGRTPAGDGTVKYLLALEDGATVEAVSMPEGARATLCLSSQTGCAVGCTFCVTGALGPGRNLTPAEMVGQYRLMVRELPPAVERVNLVFMGMGEPLLNTTALGTALEALYETVSPKRITVSTSGIIPGIRWLAGLPRPPKLAVSLNAPDQRRREQVMPIAARYPLPDLLRELRRFPLEGGRRITFEYVLIRGFNDAEEDAAAVARLLRGIPSKVNVIPLNEDPLHLPGLERPAAGTVGRFAERLRSGGLVVTVRWSRGSEVAAACGQLKGRHQARSTTSESCLPALSPSRR
jgi:23S rRNA (adenine2503-C2)-methyltransferase